jgi:dihydrofolate synthase/folylpolyglutamate synthase
MLGNTITAIAGEKAGIIKKGSTVVISPQTDEADATFSAVCAKQGAKLIRVGKEVTYESTGFSDKQQSLIVHGRLGTYEFVIPLLGQYQLSNAATAVAALEVLIEKGAKIPLQSIINGMKDVNWEGRLQILCRHPLVIADGAHNQDSAQKLRLALQSYFKYEQGVLVIGMSSDKDLAGIAAELAPIFKKVIVTRSTHPRAMETAPIAAEFSKHGITAQETQDIAEAFPLALRLAGKNDMVCVTGSLFIAAGAIEQAVVLGLKP